jgi:hypothetical protein
LYGPYAENLRHVLNEIEGHYITGYADGGDAPDKPLELFPDAVNSALIYLEAHPVTKARFEHVAKLCDGFEIPFGMELLATVHWAAMHGAGSLKDVVRETHTWNKRKRMFSARQIEIAYDRLAEQGWLQQQRLPV